MSSPRPVQHDPGPLPGRLRGVLEPIVTGAGFELEELDVATVGRRHTVKLVVDSDSGVGLDDIAGLSRAAATELEQHEDELGESYTLEVTSPGVGRPLTQPRHWRRAHLRLVTVRPHEGAAYSGRVGPAGADAVTLLVGGELRRVSYADVAHAAVEVEFAPPPASELARLNETELAGATDTTPEETP